MPRRVSIPLFTFAILATPVVLATLADQGPPAPGQVRENPEDKLKYVWIPRGSFMMGCSVSFRNTLNPGNGSDDLGVRCVREVE